MNDPLAIDTLANLLCNLPEACHSDHRPMAEQLLDKLTDVGFKLLPPGAFSFTQYGREQKPETVGPRLVPFSPDRGSRRYATHRRTCFIWPSEQPSDMWAQYLTEWTPLEKNEEDDMPQDRR